MTVETAAFLNSLNASYPEGSSPAAQLDDHVRLIKAVLKATFPNLTGAVTLTQTQINTAVPVGAVMAFSGTDPGPGWAICDGRVVAHSDGSGNFTTPDLRDKFVVGVSSTTALGVTGGSQSNTLDASHLPSHVHTFHAVGSTDLAGAHNHIINDPGHTHTVGNTAGGTNTGFGSIPTDGAWAFYKQNDLITSQKVTGLTLASASDHVHPVTVSGTTDASGASSSLDNRPPFYALLYIIKV